MPAASRTRTIMPSTASTTHPCPPPTTTHPVKRRPSSVAETGTLPCSLMSMTNRSNHASMFSMLFPPCTRRRTMFT